jgi:hypothetical protein
MILRQDQPSRYAGLKCASRKLSPRNLPRERFSSLAQTRSERIRLSRLQFGVQLTRSNEAVATQLTHSRPQRPCDASFSSVDESALPSQQAASASEKTASSGAAAANSVTHDLNFRSSG